MALIKGNYKHELISDFSPIRKENYNHKFIKNANARESGYIFKDVLKLDQFNGVKYYTSNFGGSSISYRKVNGKPVISGGEFTGYKQEVFNSGKWVLEFGVAGFKISAKEMYNAVMSTSLSDDRSIVSRILSGNDRFELSESNDKALGLGGNDVMLGRGGNDYLDGGLGNDIIDGGIGNDIIIGGAGADRLTGGAGVDTFRYTALSDSRLAAYDRITDFAIGTDRIDAPTAVSAANVRQLGRVNALTQREISKVLTKQTFQANHAATFTLGTGRSTRTFLALNDNRAGFDSARDGLIDMTGYSGNLSNLAII